MVSLKSEAAGSELERHFLTFHQQVGQQWSVITYVTQVTKGHETLDYVYLGSVKYAERLQMF